MTHYLLQVPIQLLKRAQLDHKTPIQNCDILSMIRCQKLQLSETSLVCHALPEPIHNENPQPYNLRHDTISGMISAMIHKQLHRQPAGRRCPKHINSVCGCASHSFNRGQLLLLGEPDA